MASTARPRGTRSWTRVAITTVLTVLLVAGEFLLLDGVYHRGDAVREQRVVHAALQGGLESATGPQDPAWLDRALAQVAALDAAGLPADEVRALREAVDDAAGGRTDDARDAGREVGSALTARAEAVDDQAAAI